MNAVLPSAPTVAFSPLPSADGSVHYRWLEHDIVASVNGPIEPQRRDELPEDAYIEVNVRQASGGGGPRERLIEQKLQQTLVAIVLTQQHPRSLIQVTLQVLKSTDAEATSPPAQAESTVLQIPHLLNAAVLALMNANIPLKTTCVALCACIDGSGDVNIAPSEKSAREATSLHAVSFDANGEVMLLQSEGRFGLKAWRDCMDKAKAVCLGEPEIQNGDSMQVDKEDTPQNWRCLLAWLRHIVEQELKQKMKWRES